MPSDLCSPDTYTWHNIEHCIPKLDENKYTTFSDGSGSSEEKREVDFRKVKFFLNQSLVKYSAGLVSSLSSTTRVAVLDYMERTQQLAEDMISVLRDTDSGNVD